MAVDVYGNTLIAGQFVGTLDFGGGPLTSANTYFPDIYLAKFNASGAHVWSQSFGDATFFVGEAWVAADGSGNVIIAGYFGGTVDFGGGPLTAAGYDDIFVAKFDANGTHVWSQRIGDGDFQGVASVAVDGSGSIVITGRWGGTPFPPFESHPYIYITKLDADGNQLWSQSFGGGTGNEHDAYGTSAVDGSGNVFVTGVTLDLGFFHCILAKLDANGDFLWYQSFGDVDNQAFASVAADGSGNVILTGSFFGTVDFGGGPLTSTGDSDVFVVKFEGSGSHLWSRQFVHDSSLGVGRAATDGSDNVVITGGFAGNVDFGGGSLTSAGGGDIFVAILDSNGNHRWSRRFGDVDDQSGSLVAAYGSSNIVITGGFNGAVDFGGGLLTSAGGADIFLAKFMEGPLPVLITSFEAKARGGSVEVTWDVWSDEALESYQLFRRDNSHPQTIVIAEGPFNHATRSYIDASAEPGVTYHYELLIHTQGGDDIRSPVATAEVPSLEATLGQNFPNPFNPATTIVYTLNEQSSAVLGIYDAAGQLVVRLDQGSRDAGTHRVVWDGRDASGKAVGSGVYFYRIEGVPRVAPKKMVLVR
jgi:hypothetical protein